MAETTVASEKKDTQKKAADPKGGTVTTKEVYPASGIVAPLGVAVDAEGNWVEDYYRDGTPTGNNRVTGMSKMPARMVEPFGTKADAAAAPIQSSIRVRGKNKDGKEIDLLPAYTKFIISNVQESYTERSQIVETFGDAYVFMFGSRPSIFNFSGTLINSINVNWVQDFMFYYENYFRGTKLVELKARAILTYGGRQVEGMLLGTSNQTDAVTEEGVPFNFQLVVFKRNYLGFSEDFGLVRGPGGKIISDPKLRALVNRFAGPEGKGTAEPETSEDLNVVKDAAEGKQPPSAAYGNKYLGYDSPGFGPAK